MNIAHLAFDQKFVPFAQSVFEEAFPGRNLWFILHGSGSKFDFLREWQAQRVVTARFLLSRQFREKLADFDLLVTHTMIPPFAGAVANTPGNLKVFWFAWGYDYYPYIEKQFGDLLLPCTKATRERVLADRSKQRTGNPYAILKHHLRPFYRAIKKLIGGEGDVQSLESIASRIDFCCVTPQDLPYIRRAFPTFHAEHYQLHYFSTEDTLQRGPAMMAGPDILLGNSAMPENNHMEAIDLLRRMPVDDRKIIAPLSYGDSHYADEICRIGARVFGSGFVPLRSYLPIDEYHDLLATCGTVVMNHRRQAAMGNISAALYKGARVILREENPIYQTYSNLGAALDSMHSIEQSPYSAVSPLSAEERSRNRKIVGEYMDRSSLVESIRRLEAYCRPLARPGNAEVLGVADRG